MINDEDRFSQLLHFLKSPSRTDFIQYKPHVRLNVAILYGLTQWGLPLSTSIGPQLGELYCLY